jgi:hypothetical protein
VDDLLSSTAYGERWTSLWLDLSRYADTKGYEKDVNRNIWKYRDWLINAFNTDKPYNDFLTEQIAGDLMPDPDDAKYIATAFQRNTMTNDEGGTDNEEFRTAAVLDRVNTTWSVLMGSTFNCVQCHSHPMILSSMRSIISSRPFIITPVMRILIRIILYCDNTVVLIV